MLVVAWASGASSAPGPADTALECVVLLHGLGRTYRSMGDMADALRDAGYLPVNIDYPSREFPIETLAEAAVGRGIERCRRAHARRIHFVTHSLGGILARYYLAHEPLPELGRVVMLSPPNRGSEVADALADNPLYVWLNGPAGQQLGTGSADMPARLGPVDYPTGVITGDRAAFYDAWLTGVFDSANDGKVSVERARVEGMTDFLVVPYTHTFIMAADDVIRQTLHFLRHGRFFDRHPTQPAPPR